MPAESANATTRGCAPALMPIAVAAVSLPRSASRYRPVVPRRTRITRVPTDGEHRHAEEEERVVVRRTNSGSRDVERERAAADPAERHEDAVEHQRERERGEREVDAAEPQHRDREQRADDRGEHRADEHRRAAPGRSHACTSCAVVNPPTRRERRLAQRDLARHAGDHRDRQEDDGEDDRLGHEQEPERRRARTARCTMPSHDDRAPSDVRGDASGRGCALPRRAPGGGGSTPASGSVTSRRWRSPGQNSSRRNSTTNGSDGRRPVGEDAVEREVAGEDPLEDPEQEPAERAPAGCS